MKLIKLSEKHYIVVDDTEIKEGDWIGFPNLKKFVPVQYFGGDLTGYEKKITHSTQPESLGMGWMQSVQPLLLSEVKELLGVVDVEKKAFELAILFHNTYEKLAPAFGYETRLDTKVFDKNSANGKLMIAVCKEIYQALEDNKEKKYTEDDMQWALHHAKYHQELTIEQIIEALHQPKTEWNVEFVDGKLKLV